MIRVAVRALVHLVSAAAGLLTAAWLLDGDLTVTTTGFVATVTVLTVALGVLQPVLGPLLARLPRGGAGRSPVTATQHPARRSSAPVGAPRAPAGRRRGPVEFVALAFSGECAPAEVTSELARLAADRRLGLIDVVVVRRRTRDELEVLPVEEVGAVAGVQHVTVSSPGTVRGDDVAAMARDLTPGTSAVLVVFERRRARALVAAARDVEAAALAHHLAPFPLLPGRLDPPSASN